ncbi:MAG: hypothetical protein DDT29_02015 [Dehalococcoidia bacterium]|nr:hypothetical protein [Bacillota bacterium]
MLYHSLPQHRSEFSFKILGSVLVLNRWRYMKHPANTDQDASCTGILYEGHLLGIEKAQRLLWLEMVVETVQQRLLVVPILNPLGAEGQIRLALRLHIQTILLTKFFHGFTEHPCKR